MILIMIKIMISEIPDRFNEVLPRKAKEKKKKKKKKNMHNPDRKN